MKKEKLIQGNLLLFTAMMLTGESVLEINEQVNKESKTSVESKEHVEEESEKQLESGSGEAVECVHGQVPIHGT